VSNKYKNIPVEEISMDELREKEDAEDESTFFEHKLGDYCEMDTDSIGITADLSRLFKMGFSLNCKFACRKQSMPILFCPFLTILADR
jgi:hypothetical protein